jgi:hypothetical protein
MSRLAENYVNVDADHTCLSDKMLLLFEGPACMWSTLIIKP